MEISNRQLTGVKHKIRIAAASSRALAKAVVQVAAEVNADLIVLKTHGAHRALAPDSRQRGEEIVRTAPCPVLTLSPLAQEKAAHLRLQQSVDA